jgi:amino acid adenylation domain-containing protein/FkbH-like protein
MIDTVAETVAPSSVQSKRALLAERLRRASAKNSAPLSFAQQRLWLLDQLEPNTALYNVPSVARLKGSVSAPALESALNQIIARHQALRTGFKTESGAPQQLISPKSQIQLRTEDASRLPESQRPAEIRRLIRDEATRPFNLCGNEPLIRAMLLRTGPDECLVGTTMHHIVCDEWSLKVFYRELAAFYAAALLNEPAKLPELPIQYADYAVWQRQWLKGATLDEQLNFWTNHLAPPRAVTEITTDRARGSTPTFRGRTITRELAPHLKEGLARILRAKQSTSFMTLLAAFYALVHRYTGMDDVIVGTPIAGRNRAETEGLIGFFVNTLLLRASVAENPSFEELLGRVRAAALGAYAHQDVPFEKVVEALRLERSLDHLPLTKLMFAVQHREQPPALASGIEMELIDVDTETAKFDITFVLQESENGLTARVEYNSDLFEAATMWRMVEHYENLLEGIVENPARRISELPMIGEAERNQLLVQFNKTDAEYPRDASIQELFEARVEKKPDALAAAFDNESVTYGDLNRRANQLAHYLRSNGVGRGTPVAICVERSVDMLAGFLGILKAGGAYVPLDPRYPKARLEYILTDTRAPVLIAQKHLLPNLPQTAAKTICLETEKAKILRESAENSSAICGGDDLAYIIYTSGSTGKPKGVAVPHRGVNRLVLNTNYIQLGESDRLGQISNISFDAATFEIWGALLNGGQLRGISAEIALSPADFAAQLREQGVTAMFLTSALFSQLSEIPGVFETVRTVIAGGDALDPKAVRAVLSQKPPMRLVNGYGPTENTTFTCCCLLNGFPEEATNVPIGRPISNTQVFIVDKYRNPVPIGVPGELFTGGDGLAIGYWERPELNAEKFVTQQFDPSEPPRRLYRTGDLARFLPDGNVEFLGRIDNQVKIRGFRVEPGEIENALSQHPQVRECAVVALGTGAGQRKIAAYYAGKNKPGPSAPDLRRFLSERLPDYMVPSAFVSLDALPLTENGKVDRRALPDPSAHRPQGEKKYASPRDAVELELTRIWENVLGVQPVGIEDRFFDLGGHSLLAARVVAEIEKAFGKKLKLSVIFQAQTVEELAAIVRNETREGDITCGTCAVTLQPKGTQTPLFFVHGAGGGMFWGYVNLSRRLGTEQPVYAFDARALDERGKFETIEEMAAQYVADLRRIQPRGPYQLGGYCFGGNVAFEMARQLQAQGEEISFLALLNCAPPNSKYFRISWTPLWGARFVRNLLYCMNSARQWTAEQRNGFLQWKWNRLKQRLSAMAGGAGESKQPAGNGLIDMASVPEGEREIWTRHIRALMNFRPRPFKGLVHLFRSASHPIFCSFAHDYGWGELAQGGVAVTVVPGAHERILEEPWVERLATEFKKVLTSRTASVQPPAAAPAPAALASRPSAVMTPEEEHKVLIEFNRTESEFPRDKSLVHLFDEQAAKTPAATALVCGERRLTYSELRARATRIALELRRMGVGSETLVGICLERSEEMVAGILGTLQAGGAYVPLDPAYPKERLANIIQDARAPVLLTQRKLLGAVPQTDAKVLCVEDIPASDAFESQNGRNAAPLTPPPPTNLAYVLYTSGSTGQPKGVAVEHRSAVAFVAWARNVFSDEELNGVLFATSICFDLSIFEMFVPLSLGGKVILANNAIALPTLPAANEVHLVNTVPSAIRELLRIKGVPSSVRVVNLAGEPLSTPLVDEIYKETNVAKVYDLYGPTETTTYSTFTLRKAGEPATIGRPLANEQVYLLNEKMRPVPIGEIGDLYIGGAGLARGYLNRPQMTAERFIANPFKPGERIYKTGDLARWRPDGNLIFLGRADQQVKIRGFRIELGEIEAVLKSSPGVRDAVVVAREATGGDKRLAAYVVRKEEGKAAAEDLRKAVKDKLPAYMTPSAFVFMPALPLTPNGKVDRKVLPEPDWDQRESANIVESRTPTEKQLAEVWSEVLGVKNIGVTDNFLDLGGHSLLAIQVVSRLREKLQLDLPLSCVLDAPTVEQMAAAVDSGRWKPASTSIPPVTQTDGAQSAPASFVQERLWFLHELDAASDAYNVPAALRLKGSLDFAALQRALDEIVKRHEVLRTQFELVGGTLVQKNSPTHSIKIERSDLRGSDRAQLDSRVAEWVKTETGRPFDLKNGPMLRASVAQLDSHEYALLTVMHHAVTDGWSISIFFRELETLYRAFASAKPAPPLPPLPLQYADFARWQRAAMQGTVLENDLAYWKSKLDGAPPELELPTDRNPATASSKGDRTTFRISAQTLRAMRDLARREGATPFMVLMSAMAITLYKWTRKNDLVLGTVVGGRNRREFENLIGCFMNFVPLRIGVTEDASGAEILRNVRTTFIEAQNHQECPFEKIVDALRTERRNNRNPIYNVAVLYQNFPALSFNADALRASPVAARPDAALLDLLFEAEENAEGLSLMCEYRRDLFDAATIEQLLSSCATVLETLTQSTSLKIADLKISPALQAQLERTGASARKEKIVVAATFTAEPIEEALQFWMNELEMPAEIEFAPYNQVFQQLLDPGSALAGNRGGLNVILIRLEDWQRAGAEGQHSADSSPEQSIERSIREFSAALEGAAARAKAPCLVCVCPPSKAALTDASRGLMLARMEKSLMAAVDKFNDVYFVTSREINALYPVAEYDEPVSEELGHIPYTPVFFTALATVIARKFHAMRRTRCKVIVLDCDGTLWGGVCGEDGAAGIRPYEELQRFVRRQQEAGVLLCICSKNEEADVRSVFATRSEMPLSAEHISAWRVNWRLKSENLKSLAQELQLGLDSFVFIDDNPVECAEVEANCPEVLTLQLPTDAAKIPAFLDHCWVFDHFKTTEEDRQRAAMYRQNKSREEYRAQSSNFEGFISGLQLRIKIAPMSEADLSRVSQLTQRTNQFNTTGRRRTESDLKTLPADFEIYTVTVSDRFGDYGMVGVMMCGKSGSSLNVDSLMLSCRVLGRGVEHRMLAFLGERARAAGLNTVDIQFKDLPRNRPALQFLESVGSRFKQTSGSETSYSFPAAAAAGAVFKPTNADIGSAPVVDGEKKATAAAGARKFARCRSIALDFLDAAKIHARIEAKSGLRSASAGGYVAPRSPMEKQLCELWQKLLRVERVGIQDDFFTLGGNSLMAVRLFAELEKVTGRKFPLVTLFQAPTIEKLAATLDSGDSAATRSVLVPIQPRGNKPPLFLVHGAGGDVLWGYANLVAHMEPDQPIFALKSRGQAGLEEFTSLDEMAAFYANEIRTFQPQGPYYLGGYCFGGNVAYEMARKLQNDGQTVALVALLDSAPSNAGYERVLWWRPSFVYQFSKNLCVWLKDFRNWSARDRRRFFLRKARTLGRKILKVAGINRKTDPVDVEEVIDPIYFPESELKLWQIHLNALATHVQRPYSGRVTLFRTKGNPLFSSYAEDMCWGNLIQGLEIKHVPGSHENVFMEPHVRVMAQTLTAAISEAAANSENQSKTNPTEK